MPPRWLTVAILAFWLCTSSWLVYQEVWPLFLPAAPPFAIDLEDEVQTHPAHVRWVVTYNDREWSHLETWVEPDLAADTFQLHARRKRPALSAGGEGPVAVLPGPLGAFVTVGDLESVYRVSRAGELRSIQVTFDLHVRGLDPPVHLVLTGEVRDGNFLSHLRVAVPGAGVELNEELQPIPASANGAVLSPLHPANRLSGLRPGQSWRQPLVDPLTDAVKALTKTYSEKFSLPNLPSALGDDETEVVARVLPTPQKLVGSNREVPCLVVEYTGKRLTARTWVDAESGLVLRQEAERDGDRVAMERDQSNPVPSYNLPNRPIPHD